MWRIVMCDLPFFFVDADCIIDMQKQQNRFFNQHTNTRVKCAWQGRPMRPSAHVYWADWIGVRVLRYRQSTRSFVMVTTATINVHLYIYIYLYSFLLLLSYSAIFRAHRIHQTITYTRHSVRPILNGSHMVEVLHKRTNRNDFHTRYSYCRIALLLPVYCCLRDGWQQWWIQHKIETNKQQWSPHR